eukprot:1147362-Pelagomonas_calceolata.AAC.3
MKEYECTHTHTPALPGSPHPGPALPLPMPHCSGHAAAAAAIHSTAHGGMYVTKRAARCAATEPSPRPC